MSDTLTDARTAALGRALIGCRKILDPIAGFGRVHTLNGLIVPVRSNKSTTPWVTLDLETIGIEIDPEVAAQHPLTRHGNPHYLPFPYDEFDAICTSPSVKLPWGPSSKAYHIAAWAEAVRVLRPGGRFVLHAQENTTWHVEQLRALGLQLLCMVAVSVGEHVVSFLKPTPQTAIGVIQDSDVR